MLLKFWIFDLDRLHQDQIQLVAEERNKIGDKYVNVYVCLFMQGMSVNLACIRLNCRRKAEQPQQNPQTYGNTMQTPNVKVRGEQWCCEVTAKQNHGQNKTMAPNTIIEQDQQCH